MTHYAETMTARTLIRDYERREIEPDKRVEVAQGWLYMWLVGNRYAAMMRVGTITTAGEALYLSTYSAQEIADDICPRKDWELTVGIAAIAGRALNSVR